MSLRITIVVSKFLVSCSSSLEALPNFLMILSEISKNLQEKDPSDKILLSVKNSSTMKPEKEEKEVALKSQIRGREQRIALIWDMEIERELTSRQLRQEKMTSRRRTTKERKKIEERR